MLRLLYRLYRFWVCVVWLVLDGWCLLIVSLCAVVGVELAWVLVSLCVGLVCMHGFQVAAGGLDLGWRALGVRLWYAGRDLLLCGLGFWVWLVVIVVWCSGCYVGVVLCFWICFLFPWLGLWWFVAVV